VISRAIVASLFSLPVWLMPLYSNVEHSVLFYALCDVGYWLLMLWLTGESWRKKT